MKIKIASMMLALMAFGSALIAGDVTYLASMTGACGGCKKEVSSAFSSLKGFKSISIKDAEEAGTQVATIVFEEGTQVTKEQAIKSLGDKASKFVVKTWKSKK